jgi:hypothetical protein
MVDHPNLAGFEGNDSMELSPQNIKPRKAQKEALGKYAEFFGALKSSTLAETADIDQQTGLEFENIEGEVMGEVLASALTSGSMYNQVTDPFFTFESPDFILNKIFADKFMEAITRNPHVFLVLKRQLNSLMISFKRQGRQEMVQIAQALSISLSESEKKDPFTEAIKRR